jgi:hypothetical protein
MTSIIECVFANIYRIQLSNKVHLSLAAAVHYFVRHVSRPTPLMTKENPLK